MMIKKSMYINGKWTEAIPGQKVDIINPCNGEKIAEVPSGDREDARLAVKAAGRAFEDESWSGLSATRRGEMVHKLGDLIKRDLEELARLETLNTGKTVEESRWDMDEISGIFRYYAALADKEAGEVINSPFPNTSSMAVREPVGVCAQISPWNYPLLQAAWKLAPALAAGCTVVMKPSEITPLTALKTAELVEEAGFPPGVVNVVLGPGSSVGAELSENPDVDLISFTGGINTGKRIIKAASENVKKMALELGGKNPNIIFSDADFDTALDYALNGVFFHAGQICSAGARILVQDEIHDRFVEALKERMSRIVIGDGFGADTQMGPLISADHLANVENYVSIAREEGAKLVLGGERPENPELESGFYFQPTLFTECTKDMRIVQEEVFGPVISVERFGTEQEAIDLANGTVYGLSAGFWTRDPDRIYRVSRALKFGTVWINDFNIYFTQAPWGGYKQSGLGRELGRTGLEEYTEIKHIYQNHATKPVNWFGC